MMLLVLLVAQQQLLWHGVDADDHAEHAPCSLCQANSDAGSAPLARSAAQFPVVEGPRLIWSSQAWLADNRSYFSKAHPRAPPLHS